MVFKGRFFSSKKSDSSSPDASSNSPRSFSSNSPFRSDKKKAKSAAHPTLAAGGGGGGALAACRQTQVKDGTKKKDVVKGKESQTPPPEARTEGLVEDLPLWRGWWTLRPKWILKKFSGMKWVTGCRCVFVWLQWMMEMMSMHISYGLGPNWPEAESYVYGTGWWPRPKGVPFDLAPICLGSRPEAKCGKQRGQKALTVLV